MKSFVMALAAAASLSLASGAFAADPQPAEALAKKNGCLACHTVDKKVLGPSYKDIAAKYRNNKGAGAELIKKVKAGGKGVWGDVPMPPNAHVKDEDIKTMVQWILSIK
ncbi:MAG: cytochrome C [Betaproteobacteria bacterium RIFCSPLOWO2_12_FULL_62_13]|nr:MAG: cytochrome C [Betaproteobacteria bacterium RIFCSPLOWO2_12_FULL_62_13]